MPEIKKNKVAIVSDVVMRQGGAEKVLMAFLEMFPEADLYSLFVVPGARQEIKKRFPKVKICTSIFQNLVRSDKVSKYISLIKFVSWIYWESLGLKKYDLVISSSHSFMSKNVKKREGARHLAYVHTPPRFLYDEFCEIGLAKKLPLGWLRIIDKNGSKRPDVMVVNSENVAKRVKKYYQRESVLVYPPVEVELKNNLKKKNYYVCLSRLVKQKGIDLAVRTCTKYGLPLVVMGDGDEFKNLKKIAGKTVKFFRKCDDKKKELLLAGAKALIYTSIEEDFGMVPVEALKLGVPVVAFKSGGVKEVIADGINGVFFGKFEEENLKLAIDRLDKIKIEKKTCMESVKNYSFYTFKKQILKILFS